MQMRFVNGFIERKHRRPYTLIYQLMIHTVMQSHLTVLQYVCEAYTAMFFQFNCVKPQIYDDVEDYTVVSGDVLECIIFKWVSNHPFTLGGANQLINRCYVQYYCIHCRNIHVSN